MQIMKALFNGKIIPWERRNNYSVERKALEERIENEKRYFIGKMSLDDSKRFEAFISLCDNAAYDEEVEIYSYGFTLGTLLMLEIAEKIETIINE